MAGENTLSIRINGSAKEFLNELDKVKKQTQDTEKILQATAKASAAAFLAFAASVGVVSKAFADYETALVGVGKTTNIEGRRLQQFGKEFQNLSSTIPLSTNELLGIAQAAGQLGVSGEQNLIKFTETVAKLGVATDLTGEQAAVSLTRILNVTGESIDSIDKFGSVIVELGNNFAATESEIVRVATEVSRSTAVFGVSAAQSAGLATALRSVGVQAQLGGSAVGRGFREIDAAIRQGGAALENLSQVTGIAGDQLKKTFQDDSTAVFQAFIEGIGRIQQAGGDTTAALEAFNLKGDEILKVLPVLAKNSELLGDALGTAAEEAKNATALNTEAEKAFATLSSTASLTGNNLTNLAANIGEQLAPAITELLLNVNSILKQLSELDTETLGLIATFLKWGTIITGAVAGLSAFLLGALKLSAIIGALSAAFLPATVAASAFWVAVTGPIGIAIAGIAALTAGFFALKSSLNDDEEPKSLAKINEELNKIKKSREEVANIQDPAINNADNLARLDEEIKKLEELKMAKIEASEDFGTGALLQRTEAEPFDPSNVDLGFEEQAIPLRADVAGGESPVEKVKEQQAEITEVIDEETQRRIAAAKAENDALAQIQEERLNGATNRELEFLQRKAEIEAEILEAEQIQNEQERELALDNLALKHAEELQAINDFENVKDEERAAREEERAALDAELRELDVEQRNLFNQEDFEALSQKIDSQRDAEVKAAKERINRRIAERNQFKKDEIEFGTTIANLKQFFNKQEVQGFSSTTQQLTQLSQSRNSTLKGIGKAAARVNAAIATAEGAIKAYSSLSGIPIIGPVLGAAAAASLIAFGVEQQGKISSAQTGGFVPPTSISGGARDRVPTLLEPGELVVPQAIAPNFIQAAGLPDTQQTGAGGEGVGGNAVVEIMLEDRAGEVISLEQREGRALGLING